MMSYVRGNCRCCCSSGKLKTLPEAVMDVYKLICSLQDLENDDNKVLTCFQCCKFLEEVHQFKLECYASVGIFSIDLVSKCLNVESTFNDPIQEKSSQINMKTNVIDEIQEIHQNDTPEFDMKQDNGPFSCELCSFTTTGKHSLKIHMRTTHTNERPFACDQCDYRAKRKGHIINHRFTHMDQIFKPFKCTECSFQTTTITKLKYHVVRKHSDEKPFKCDLCDYRGKQKIYITSHMKTHLKDCEKSYKCNECSYTTAKLQYLKRHVLSRHRDERPFACNHCNYRCKLKTVLIKHINIHLKNSVFKCSQCPYESLSQYGLTSHTLFKHSNDKPFSCDQCEYRTKKKAHLVKHKEVHLTHRNKPFKCSECSFETTRLSIVRSHFVTKHSDEKPFACNQCDYRGKTKNLLTSHTKTHLDDSSKSYKCSECSYKTRSLSSLKCHALGKHSDERRFQCDHCGHRTKTRTLICRHIKIHEKDCGEPSKYHKVDGL